MIPAHRVEIIPNELFIKTGLSLPGRIVIGRPEPRRIRGQDLINDHHLLRRPVQAEFKFGIRDDDPARFGQRGRPLIHRNADPPDLLRQRFADHALHGVIRDIFIMAFRGLGRRREQRLREFLRFPQPRGQRPFTDGSLLPVFFPRRPGKIPAHDTFHGQGVGLLHDHAPARQNLHVRATRIGEFLRIHRPHVMRHQATFLPQAIKPELRQLREHVPFAGNPFRQHHVKSRNPVAGNQQQAITEVVHVPHFALSFFTQIGEIGFKHGWSSPDVTHGSRSFC